MILQGTIDAATRLAAEGLISLLHLGRLAVQLVQADQSEHSGLCVSLHKSALEVDQILGNKMPWACCNGYACMHGMSVFGMWIPHSVWLHQKHADAEDQVQRQWHKQLQAVFAWLLPEHAIEAHTPQHLPSLQGKDMQQQQQQQQELSSSQQQPAANSSTLHASVSKASEADDNSGGETGGFDVAELYAAVKPEGSEPELAGDNPKLRPTLRPYQKRAAAWMVSREDASQVHSHVVHTHW
jgi:hypothetical protein